MKNHIENCVPSVVTNKFSSSFPDRPTSTSVVRQPSDRRPDISNSSTAQSSVDFTHAHSVDTDSNAPDAEPAHRDR